jgi:hypothetical protein
LAEAVATGDFASATLSLPAVAAGSERRVFATAAPVGALARFLAGAAAATLSLGSVANKNVCCQTMSDSDANPLALY